MSLELSGTTGVKGVAGSVSAPSIVGDDTNTGISFPSADTIKFSTGGVERMAITNSGVSGVGGKILQVLQATKTDTETFSLTTQTVYQYTNLSVSITPSATDSKILVIMQLTICTDAPEKGHYGVQRTIGGSSATSIGVGDAAGSRKRFGGGQTLVGNPATTVNYSFLDSPSTTSACVYYPILGHDSSVTKTFHVNRSSGDSDSGQNARYMSSIIVQEVGA